MFGWINRWRQSRLMKRPLPTEWVGWLDLHVPFFPGLKGEERERFLRYLKAFVWSKHFFGAGGLELTDEHRVVIGAAAVRLVLHLDLSYYDRLTEIIVYPYTYRHPNQTGAILGEAHTWGTVVLSWPAVLHGMDDPKDNAPPNRYRWGESTREPVLESPPPTHSLHTSPKSRLT